MSGREQGSKRGFSMKFKLALVALVTLFAMVGIVGYVVMAHPGSSASSVSVANRRRSVDVYTEEDPISSPDTDHEVSHKEIRSRSRFTRQALTRGSSEGTHNPNYGQDLSCFTDPENDTIPAAHIKGHGKFQEPDGSSNLPGYQQRWRCCDFDPRLHNPGRSTHAFVDGGMSFNQTEKKLSVPKCGYYHVFSQILFEYDHEEVSNNNLHTTIYHLLKFDRNCPSWEESPITVMGRASIRNGDTATTHTSDVIKLCKGGKIWIEIPETQDDSCYPKGDDHATFIGAVLVAETTCHWPPATKMANVDHSHDEE